MTIRPGEDWGEVVAAPDGMLSVTDDAALAAYLESGDTSPVRVGGGDLVATLGAPAEVGSVRRVPIDAVHVTADGRELMAVAHLVARRSWWRGPVLAVMNVDRLGRWDVAPRAHPNDGRVDVVEVDAAMDLRTRWEVRRRLPRGTHVPHPQIRTRRIREGSWTFDRPAHLWVDGVERGSVHELRIAVEPDAAIVHC